jgi:hypothetical protein
VSSLTRRTLTLMAVVLGACSSSESKGGASRTDSSAVATSRTGTSRPCGVQLTPIQRGRLGSLSVGMLIRDLQAVCPQAAPVAGTDEEGAPVTLYVIPVNRRDTVVADIDSVAAGLSVRSFSIGFAGPRTLEGIGVGSTFGEIKAKWQRVGAGDNEGRIYVWPQPDAGISFALSASMDSLDPRWRTVPTLIPDTAHVIELLVRRPQS